MSAKALNWALTQQLNKYPSKLLLLALADAAYTKKGMTTYISKRGLHCKTGLAFDTVLKHLPLLEQAGLITIKPCIEAYGRLNFKLRVPRDFKVPFKGHETIKSIMKNQKDFSNPREYLLMLALAHRMEINFQNDQIVETGLVKANQSEISKNTGLCRKTVRKSLNRLIQEGRIIEEFTEESPLPSFRISNQYLPSACNESFLSRHADTSWTDGIGMSI